MILVRAGCMVTYSREDFFLEKMSAGGCRTCPVLREYTGVGAAGLNCAARLVSGSIVHRHRCSRERVLL